MPALGKLGVPKRGRGGEGTDSKVQRLEFPCGVEVEVERDTARLLRCLRHRGRPYESIVMLLGVILHGPWRRGDWAGWRRILLHVNWVALMFVSRYVTVEAGLGPPGIYAKEHRFVEVDVQNSFFFFSSHFFVLFLRVV